MDRFPHGQACAQKIITFYQVFSFVSFGFVFYLCGRYEEVSLGVRDSFCRRMPLLKSGR